MRCLNDIFLLHFQNGSLLFDTAMQNFIGDLREARYFEHRAPLNGFFWHPKHDRRRFVLGNCKSAGAPHFKQTGGAIASHAGQNYAAGISANVLGHRAKQHIDTWPMTRNQRSIGNFNVPAGAALAHEHMAIARSDQRASRQDRIAVHRFLYFNPAGSVQTLGKRGGESFRHMLYNQKSWRIGRHRFENLAERFRAAGRSADGGDRIAAHLVDGGALLRSMACGSLSGKSARSRSMWKFAAGARGSTDHVRQEHRRFM